MSLTDEELKRGVVNPDIGTELVLETGVFKLWHLRLAPGQSIAPHRHDRPYFWTVLTDGTGRSRYGEGQVVDIVYRAGDTRHFPDLTPTTGFVHDLKNTGDQELVFVTGEFQQG